MATVTKAANAHTTVSTGWTNPSNAYGTTNDGTVATTLNGSTSKNLSQSGDFGFPDFTTSDIPDGATITSVVLDTYPTLSTSGVTGGLFGVQGYNNAVAIGTEVTSTQTTGAVVSYTYSSTPSLTDLRSASTLLKARCRGAKGNTSTALTVNLDYVSMTVTYSTAQTFTSDLTASESPTGALEVEQYTSALVAVHTHPA